MDCTSLYRLPKYECEHCGACCAGHLFVEVDEIDLLREARLFEAKGPYWEGKTYDQVLEEMKSEGKVMLLALNAPCAFLGPDKLCTIYPTRPNCCVAMEAGDEQCQEARDAAGLPPLPALDNEEPEKLQRNLF